MILTHFFNTRLATPRRASKMCWCFTRQTKHRISCNTLTTKLFSSWTEIAKTKWVSSTRMSTATISPQPLNLRAVWGSRTDRINRCLAPISTRLQMECLYKRMAIKEGRARTHFSLRSISLEGRADKQSTECWANVLKSIFWATVPSVDERDVEKSSYESAMAKLKLAAEAVDGVAIIIYTRRRDGNDKQLGSQITSAQLQWRYEAVAVQHCWQQANWEYASANAEELIWYQQF